MTHPWDGYDDVAVSWSNDPPEQQWCIVVWDHDSNGRPRGAERHQPRSELITNGTLIALPIVPGSPPGPRSPVPRSQNTTKVNPQG